MGRAVVRMTKDELRDRMGVSDYICLSAVQFNPLTDRVEIVFDGSGLPSCVDGAEPRCVSLEDPELHVF